MITIQSVTQVGKKVKMLCKYLVLYLFCAFLVIIFYAWIYYLNSFQNAFKISFEIFWSIENNIPDYIKIWGYTERITNDLFSIILVGTVLAKFLNPINPILFAPYIVYDTVDRKFSIRYWIMLPKGHYLFDVKIKLLLTDYENHQTGVNKINSTWSIDENKLNYNQIRGIRFIELSELESSELIKSIECLCKKHIHNGEYIGGKYSIDLSIRGTSENGITYHGWHRYEKEDILIGYRHIPMQRHSYESEDFYREKYLTQEEKDLINPSADFYLQGKKEFFRFQHFNKVYQLPNHSKAEKAKKNKDILTKQQIIHGQYSGIRQLLLDFCSFLTWFFIDSDRKFAWIMHKALEYFLHITHLRRF